MTTNSVKVGEQVLVVPQRWHHLVDGPEGVNLLGKGREAADECLVPGYGNPYWADYTAGMPGWSYGLLLIRDGVFVRGPEHFDTSD